LGDRVEIVEGLKPGERIVVSGHFLIDSETRMQSAGAGMVRAHTQDPVCGHGEKIGLLQPYVKFTVK